MIKQSQTCKEVVNHCRASAAQRSEAVLCKVPFVCVMCMFCCSISRSLLQCICKDFFSMAYTTLAKEGEIKQRAGPVIKYSQTFKEVVNQCRASAAQRSEAVLSKAPFVYDMHVLLFNL